jgi:hypothetical protein
VRTLLFSESTIKKPDDRLHQQPTTTILSVKDRSLPNAQRNPLKFE